ncbi:helix-turn-helix transcriptional regulator [Paraglaciecola sp. 20A4]|uniref:helix-turn-helix domain-containing protein n=1 Tax=Paraglaciecola sp. 20A4 TaxID=2687288 RepID=UPI00140DA32C|nr:helix-turn-helix transcriptional regulator [Paraglaciecola sp. 20A4]|tara:strand:- start:6912 stop:7181 length:270 start_codon:yes stop_codon:yes gene_type:complete
MYKSMQLIDMLKKKHTFRSDNDVAKKLGISRSAVSRYRNSTGSIDDKLAVEIAEMLTLDPFAVLASMRCERAARNNSPTDINFWRKYAA